MDEVSGRGASSLAKSSKQCAQCAESGTTVSAVVYCQSCTDYLCTNCVEQHKAIRALRDHIFLENENNAEQKPIDVENCPVHSDRRIEVYCSDDDTFGCALCLLGHKSCKNVALLSEISSGVESSKEFLDVQKAAGRCESLEDEYKHIIENFRLMNNECYTKTKEDFQVFRDEILSTIDIIETKVFAEADTLKEDNERQLDVMADKITAFSEELKEYIVRIYDKKNSNGPEHIFIALRKNGRRILETVQRLEALQQEIAIKTFGYHFDPTIRDNLIEKAKLNAQTKSNVGVVTSLTPAIACTSVSRINTKSKEDIKDCWISGFVELSETELIFVDRDNSCLKLLDMTSNAIIKTQALSAEPFDMTRMPESRLAVTLRSLNQIQIFTADRHLFPCETINISANCLGLHSANKKLIVSFTNPAKVQILDMTGKVLHTIQHDASGRTLFQYPWYLTLSPDNALIYVSDHFQHTLTCVNNVGVVHWVYQDPDFKYPLGVTTGDGGCLYICCYHNFSIHVLSSEGARLSVIPPSHTAVHGPIALRYNSQQRTLYVSSGQGGLDECSNIKRLFLQ